MPQSAAPEPISVRVVEPARRDLVERIDLAGSVTPDEQVTVYAKTTGYLESISVDIGDRVRKGDLLAVIEAPELTASVEEKRARLKRAEAAVKQALAALAQYEAEIVYSKANYARLSAVREKAPDALPEHEVDQARAMLGVAESKLCAARAGIEAARASVGAARAELETLKRLAEYLRIVAPIRGVVTERFVDPGDLVQAASSSRTQAAPIVSLARVDRVRIVVDAPEPAAPRIHVGSQAEIVIPGLGEPFTAAVSRTSRTLSPTTRTMRVEFDIENRDGRLAPGATASVSLVLRNLDGVLTIPIAALQASSDPGSVFVVEGGEVRRQAIELGLQLPDVAEVVAGLTGSEQVVETSLAPLSEGAAVAVAR